VEIGLKQRILLTTNVRLEPVRSGIFVLNKPDRRFFDANTSTNGPLDTQLALQVPSTLITAAKLV